MRPTGSKGRRACEAGLAGAPGPRRDDPGGAQQLRRQVGGGVQRQRLGHVNAHAAGQVEVRMRKVGPDQPLGRHGRVVHARRDLVRHMPARRCAPQ